MEDNHYDVYIGNLDSSVSSEQLEDLFGQVGKIKHIWINKSFAKMTYGFIGFVNLYEAEEACIRFNNKKINSFEITVRISNKTKLKSTIKRAERRNDSILLDLPKKKGPSKNHQVKLHLLKDLKENKDIVKDFKQVCFEIENIASPQLQMIKTAPEPPTLTALESTVIRYFKSPNQKKDLQVDFDLSKGKLLTNDQYDKFFDIQLTKPRPLHKPKKKRKIPITLDYSSVVD